MIIHVYMLKTLQNAHKLQVKVHIFRNNLNFTLSVSSYLTLKQILKFFVNY